MRSTICYRDPSTVDRTFNPKKRKKRMSPQGNITSYFSSDNHSSIVEDNTEIKSKDIQFDGQDLPNESEILKDQSNKEVSIENNKPNDKKITELSKNLSELSINTECLKDNKEAINYLLHDDVNRQLNIINIGIAVVDKKSKVDETHNEDILKYKMLYMTVGQKILNNKDLIKEIETMSATHILYKKNADVPMLIMFGIRTVPSYKEKYFLLFDIQNSIDYVDGIIDCSLNKILLAKKILDSAITFKDLFLFLSEKKNVSGWNGYSLADNNIIPCDELLHVY